MAFKRNGTGEGFTEDEIIEAPDFEDEDTDKPTGDFTIDGKSFVIKFTQKRIELYERSNRPIMATFSINGGGLSIAELKALTSYGLRHEDGGFVNPREGLAMAGELINANGYMPVYEIVVEALQRDCDFLFKGMEADGD